MTCGIYKITNNINNKVYIGCSNNIERRWREHKTHGRTGQYANNHHVLYSAMTKYGIDNFSLEILEECSQQEIYDKEKYWIDYYNSYNNGYNMTFGGEGHKEFVKINQEILNDIRIYLLNTGVPMSIISDKYNFSVKTISDINVGNIWYDEQYKYPLRKSERNPHYFATEDYKNSKKYCKICGKELKTGNFTGYCKNCINNNKELKKEIFNSNREILPPSKEEFKFDLRKYSWAKLKEKYKVNQNRLLVWCELFGLPKLKSEINNYSLEEWEEL